MRKLPQIVKSLFKFLKNFIIKYSYFSNLSKESSVNTSWLGPDEFMIMLCNKMHKQLAKERI